MFAPAVEAWRSIAAEESSGLPVDLILATIARESSGVAGLVSHRTVPSSYTDEEIAACGLDPSKRNHDLGLMQVGPSTWRDYVKNTGSDTTPADLASSSSSGARRQIRAGAWILAAKLRRIHTLDPSAWPWPSGELNDDQILLGRLAYAFGSSGLEQRLDAAAAAGYPRTFGGLEAHHGTPAKTFAGARSLLASFRAGGSSSSSSPGSGSGPRPRPSGDGIGLFAAGLLLFYALTKGAQRRRT